ncbi:cation:dicarboxylase symporter family transporter [Aggregatibacter actinomycetemcomitans]|nr:cation:dicarboxylase symporter family transporter [Aggregatibacter actinomycetemcomitans]
MVYSVVLSFVVGFILMLLKGNIDEKLWSVLDMLLFQDISSTKSFSGLGLFYIIGQLFIRGLQMMIVPLVISSLTLSLCNLSDPKKLGRIAKTTFTTYLIFYVIAAFLAGCAAYFVKSMGWFNVNLPTHEVGELVVMEGYNPLVTIVNAVPSNIVNAMSTNTAILSVVVVSIVFGIAMTTIGEKAIPFKRVLESLNEMIQYSLNILINKLGPIAIFCMITRALAIYGIEYITPTLVWILTTIIVSLVLVCTIYPLGVFFVTGLSPFKFLKKSSKIGMFAAATNSSAATLPLNTRVCTKELGCSEEISSFILPTGMTINMNGTTVMHMIAITFIGTAAGISVTPAILVIAAFLSICAAIGTPAIPVAGTTMVYVVMMGLDFSTELCMIGYSLVLAMNYLPGMAIITLNVIGDAATNVIVNFKEKALNQDTYNS